MTVTILCTEFNVYMHSVSFSQTNPLHVCVCVGVHAFCVRACVYVRACVVAESDPRRGRGVCCDAVHMAKLFTGISTGTLVLLGGDPDVPKTSSLTLSLPPV